MASKHLHFSSNVSKTSISTSVFYDRLFANLLAKRDSSSSLPQDEDSLEGEETSTSRDVIQEHSSFQFEGVRFTPKVIEFSGAFEGKQFEQLIKLQNVAKNPALVKIGEPSSFIFHMNKHDRTVKLLPSGRSITRKLTYVYHNDDLVQRSQIRVQVNGRRIDYPIVVKEAVPVIEVQPTELDFRVINMGASAKTLKLNIINTGGRGTRFAIDLGRNELDLVVNPPRGTIRAKNQMTVLVEMVGIIEGEFYKELWITTTERPIRVPIIAEVMRPRLEVFHPNATGDFTLIDFPPTFIGTQRLDSFVLRNFSADMTLFVTFAEFAGELKSFADARKYHTPFNMFVTSAEEGRLEPFESRIVTVIFKPVARELAEGWHHKSDEDYKKANSSEYLIFCRIVRVHCIEREELEKADKEQSKEKKKIGTELSRKVASLATISSIPAIGSYVGNHMGMDPFSGMGLDSDEKWISNRGPVPFEDKDIVRLCLHGEAVEPHLLVEPNALYFQKMLIGQVKEKVIKLTNLSQISMLFKFHKVVNVTTSPSAAWLKPNQAVDVAVVFAPSFPGKHRNLMKVEIFGKSAIVYDEDESLVSLKALHVELHSKVVLLRSAPEPKLCLGISPDVTNEVGLLSELVTYGSSYPKPYAAMLDALGKSHRPEWMLRDGDKPDKFRNAIIAFPNDRPRNYRSWPAGKVCRSIFTGYFRYSPPVDDEYALTQEEFDRRSEHHRLWRQYMKKIAHFIKIKRSQEMTTSELSDYDISCMEILNFGRYPELSLVAEEEYRQHLRSTLWQDSPLPKRVLIPLSPLYLCNVKVEPKLIDFSMVAPNSSAYEFLKLHNMNSFPVSVRFIPGKSGVTLPDGDMEIIPPLSKKILKIVFKTKDFGRYNGFLDYVINGSHQFKITVSANVVPKTLNIPEEFYNVEIANFPLSAAFQPESRSISLVNILKSPVKYHWEMQSDSNFEVEPMSGEVPPRATLMNQIYFNYHPEKSFFAEAVLVSESGAMQPIKLSRRKPKPTVFFENNKIILPELSLNIMHKIKARMRNVNYYDVCFEILDWNPMPGVKVSPTFGIIKCRSYFAIGIAIQIPVVMKFQFEVKVRVQQSIVINLKVAGAVACPQIKINPMDVTMRRISAQSFDISTICVENAGTTSAHVLINFKDYPEYSVSRKKDKFHGDNDEEGINLEPGRSAKFFIHFQPSDMARYQFYLPIIINGILGPPMMQDVASEFPSYYIQSFEDTFIGFGEVTRSADIKMRLPCACINCTVSGHILKFSTLEVNFKLIPECALEEEEIEISNLYVAPVTFCIRTDDVNHKDSPFKLSVSGYSNVEHRSKSIKFQLNTSESLNLKVSFQPKRMGIFSVEAPVFVRGYNNGYAYNVIKLFGELKKSKISVDSNEIHFPPVPVGIGTDVILQVFAEHYQSPDALNCVVWEVQEFGKMVSEAVKTVWLEEPKITGEKEVQGFLIQICFQSSYPVSLRTFLIFSDTRGEYLSVLITGVCDNCALTNHIFMSMRAQKYKFIKESGSAPTEEDINDNPVRKSPSKNVSRHSANKKNAEPNKKRLKSFHNSKSDFIVQSKDNLLKVGAAPRLAIQMTKSMTRLTQLNFITVKKNEDFRKKESYFGNLHSIVLSHTDILSNTTNTSSQRAGRGMIDNVNEISYPNFPSSDDNIYYEKYLVNTLKYVEVWIYEVGFRCEEYMEIPSSFQAIADEDEHLSKKGKNEKAPAPGKTIVDLLVEFAGRKVLQYFPERPSSLKDPTARVEYSFSMFYCLLHFLFVQGSFLPHVRPELLLTYKDYVLLKNLHPTCDTLKCGAGFPLTNPFRKVSNSIVSSGSKTVDKDDIYAPPSSSLGTLNDAWNKSMFEENFDEDLNDFREPKRNVEIGEAEERPFPGARDNNADNAIAKDYVFEEEILNEKDFNLRSTQAWLDVLIQVFRTLVLTKVVPKRMPVFPVCHMTLAFVPDGGGFLYGRGGGGGRASILSDGDTEYNVETLGSMTMSSQEINKPKESLAQVDRVESNAYSYQERVLITWLSHHYELQRTVLWPNGKMLENEAPAPPREFESFRTDLMDSLFFMAVTSSYCPYLVPIYFVDVFTSPRTIEQMYHNAVKVTTAWKDINLGLSVEPRDIVASNQIFMIMIVHHLYENLPLLCPRSVIRFSAPLTEEMVRSIELRNKSNSKIVYEAKFIGDDQGSFRFLGSSTVSIKAAKKTEFRIAFRARRTEKVSVTLIFCGASVSPNFARSLVFHLEGEPSELKETSKIRITGSLYKVKCVDISIVPPYRKASHYEISYSTLSPGETDPKLLTMKPWRDIASRKIARRLFLNQELITYDGASPAVLNVTVACLTVDSRSFWLLFKSEEVGDFIIRIDVIMKRNDAVCGPIYVDIPNSWSKHAQCACIDIERNLRIGPSATSVCPLLSYIKVPSRNSFLWDAMLVMFQKVLDAREKTFWRKHFETDIGIRLINWLLSQDEMPEEINEFIPCLRTKITYTLKIDSPADQYLRIPSLLEIPDVRSEEPVYLPIHLSNDAETNFKMTLTLTSHNKKEIRTVKYIFRKKEGAEGAVKGGPETRNTGKGICPLVD